MMEIENEKRLWDGENSFKGSRMHQRQRIPQVTFYSFIPKELYLLRKYKKWTIFSRLTYAEYLKQVYI